MKALVNRHSDYTSKDTIHYLVTNVLSTTFDDDIPSPMKRRRFGTKCRRWLLATMSSDAHHGKIAKLHVIYKKVKNHNRKKAFPKSKFRHKEAAAKKFALGLLDA